jgi:Uri superfamily endonuclease
MKFITTIIKRFIKDDKKVLGRWNIDYCDKKMKQKIELANEDHCGPCGQYILDKSLNENKSLNDKYKSK